MFSAPFMRVLMILLTPANLCFMGWKKLLTKIIKPKAIKSEIEEELLTFVEEAENEGDLDEEESDLIRNAIEFNETKAEVFLLREWILWRSILKIPMTGSGRLFESGFRDFRISKQYR